MFGDDNLAWLGLKLGAELATPGAGFESPSLPRCFLNGREVRPGLVVSRPVSTMRHIEDPDRGIAVIRCLTAPVALPRGPIRRLLTLPLRLRRFHPPREIVGKSAGTRVRAPGRPRRQVRLWPTTSVRWVRQRSCSRPPPRPSRRVCRARRLRPVPRRYVRPNSSRSQRAARTIPRENDP
jgi:hypothetical protein